MKRTRSCISISGSRIGLHMDFQSLHGTVIWHEKVWWIFTLTQAQRTFSASVSCYEKKGGYPCHIRKSNKWGNRKRSIRSRKQKVFIYLLWPRCLTRNNIQPWCVLCSDKSEGKCSEHQKPSYPVMCSCTSPIEENSVLSTKVMFRYKELYPYTCLKIYFPLR